MIKILSRSVMFLSVHGVFFALVAGLTMSQPAPANAAYQVCKKIAGYGVHRNRYQATVIATKAILRKSYKSVVNGYRRSGADRKICSRNNQGLFSCKVERRYCAQRH